MAFTETQGTAEHRLNVRFHYRSKGARFLGMKDPEPSGIGSVRKKAAKAKTLADAAAIEYTAGNKSRAAVFHLSAERACAEILTEIVDLTEEEADKVEPLFTALEEQLFALGTIRFLHSPD